MLLGPIQGALHSPSSSSRHGPRMRLVVAGATGALGNEVLNQLVGAGLFASTQVLAREPITRGIRGVGTTVVGSEAPDAWPPLAADAAIVMFDPPRLFYDRERALWTPQP